MNSIAPKNKRSRKSAPKSRQGCITCKTRHVKCDETRPYCKRCAKAGRTCLGYPKDDKSAEHPQKPSENIIKSTAKLSPSDLVTTSESIGNDQGIIPSALSVRLTTANALEFRFLEYFFNRSAPAMSGFFDSNFYNSLLLQASQYEPAIRHGMMAVGAMHEHYEFSLVPTFSQAQPALVENQKPAFALHQYNKAISEINKQLSSGPGSVEAVLMCCLLFVCLDCLRGETASAVSHLRSGGNIIANWKTHSRNPHSPSGSAYSALPETPKPTDSAFVNDHLVPIFERLSCHVDGAGRVTNSEFADLINPSINATASVSESFQDIDEARAAIMNLGGVAMRFIKGIAFTKYSQQLPETQERALTGLQRKLETWRRCMDNLMERCPQLQNSRRSSVLQVQHRLFRIAVATSLSLEQTAYDNHTEDFEFLLGHAEMLVGSPESRIAAVHTEQDLQVFSMEEGVTPACFYTASKCRVPHLRRKAIELIRSGPRRQGIWNAVLLAKVSDRIVELEESSVSPRQALGAQPPPPPLEPAIEPTLAPLLPTDPALSDLPLTPESLSPPMPPESAMGNCGTSDTTNANEVIFNLDETVVSPSLPSECVRLHHTDIKESPASNPYQHVVTFFRKTNGLDKDFEIWTEQISI